jgi:hypothetical protein
MTTRCRNKVIKNGLKLGLGLLLITGLAAFDAVAEQAPTAAPAAPAEMSAPADAAMAAPEVVEEPVEPGDVAIGKTLFTGERRFTNGGPPCISCHSASVGALDGGKLGPNLTKVYADPSKNPLLNTVWVNNESIPVMGAVFSRRNITDEEMGHLRAFFQQQSKGPVKGSTTPAFAIIGIGGFVGILIVFNIIWSGRYRNRNKGTAHDALWRNYGGKGGR